MCGPPSSLGRFQGFVNSLVICCHFGSSYFTFANSVCTNVLQQYSLQRKLSKRDPKGELELNYRSVVKAYNFVTNAGELRGKYCQ